MFTVFLVNLNVIIKSIATALRGLELRMATVFSKIKNNRKAQYKSAAHFDVIIVTNSTMRKDKI